MGEEYKLYNRDSIKFLDCCWNYQKMIQYQYRLMKKNRN